MSRSATNETSDDGNDDDPIPSIHRAYGNTSDGCHALKTHM